MWRNRKYKHGQALCFTLIELLIVVAIIGILVSILMPSLSKARLKAKIAVCSSNLGQMGKAYTIDSMNNNGKVWMISYRSRKKINYYVHRPDVRELSFGKLVYGDLKITRDLVHCPVLVSANHSFSGSNNNPDNYGAKYRSGYGVNAQTAHDQLGNLPFLVEMEGQAMVTDYVNGKDSHIKEEHQFSYGTAAVWDDGHVKIVPKGVYLHLIPNSLSSTGNSNMEQIWQAISDYNK